MPLCFWVASETVTGMIVFTCCNLSVLGAEIVELMHHSVKHLVSEAVLLVTDRALVCVKNLDTIFIQCKISSNN
jgi:hypothetical protein